MKSHKFIGICFVSLLLLFIGACSANNSAKMTNIQDSAVHNQKERKSDEDSATVVVKKSKTFTCKNPNEYGFAVVQNPNRKGITEPLIPKDLNIVVGDEVLAKIELPKPDSEAKNFSLNSVEKTKAGFEIKVDWGGGLFHYEIQFNFRCIENSFYLYKVKNENFSTKNPDSGIYWDKKETKITKVEPSLPIEKFKMLNYLQ